MQPIPICRPIHQYEQLKREIDTAISDVLSSGVWMNGPWCRRFALEFAGWCGTRHCIPVGNGTDALELAMRALNIGPGDEVITVANAGGYATAACRLVGAIPVWIDVRSDTLGLNTDMLAEAVGPATRLVVATHLYGIVSAVDAIRDALLHLGRDDVLILEDCAHAHGAWFDGRRAGATGDMAAFSFYPTKNLGGCGDGGAVVTSDTDLAQRVDQLRQYGSTKRHHSDLPHGRNSRMDEIQAAILSVKLPYVDAWNDERRRIVGCYAENLDASFRVVGADDATNVGHLAVVRVPERAKVMAELANAMIGADIHYPVLDCDQIAQRGLPARKLPLPESCRARDEILSLPCFPGLHEAEVDRVIDALNRVASQTRGRGHDAR